MEDRLFSVCLFFFSWSESRDYILVNRNDKTLSAFPSYSHFAIWVSTSTCVVSVFIIANSFFLQFC